MIQPWYNHDTTHIIFSWPQQKLHFMDPVVLLTFCCTKSPFWQADYVSGGLHWLRSGSSGDWRQRCATEVGKWPFTVDPTKIDVTDHIRSCNMKNWFSNFWEKKLRLDIFSSRSEQFSRIPRWLGWSRLTWMKCRWRPLCKFTRWKLCELSGKKCLGTCVCLI